MNARYYNSEWGRFLNGDNYGGQVGDLLSHNIYAYCKNNPINNYDPTGNITLTIGLIGAVVTALKIVVAVTATAALRSINNNGFVMGGADTITGTFFLTLT